MRTLTVLFLISFLAAPAGGQEPSQPPGFHEHDGFYLSLSAGPGYSSTKDEAEPLGTFTISGMAVAFDVRIGGTIADNLVLSGDIISWSIQDPKVEREGGGSGTFDGMFMHITYGAGLTYYFMPSNIFLSGGLGAGYFSFSRGGDSFRTDPGLSFHVKAGKEWWVSADWGLGVAASFGWGSVKNTVDSQTETLSGYSVNVQFNATFH